MIEARVPRRRLFALALVLHSAEVALSTTAVYACRKNAVDHLIVANTEMLELLANLPNDL